MEKLEQYAFTSEPKIIKGLNKFIRENKTKYRNRSYFISQAIMEKMEREKCQ